MTRFIDAIQPSHLYNFLSRPIYIMKRKRGRLGVKNKDKKRPENESENDLEEMSIYDEMLFKII